MLSQESVKRVYRFGSFELDAAGGELYHDGHSVRLQPQQLQLLTVLVGKSGQIVSRNELRQVLWSQQTFVEFEDSLNHAIIRLRRVLGDSAQVPRFIETIPRRGYRFIAPVETAAPPSEPGPSDHKSEAESRLSSVRFRFATLPRARLAAFVSVAFVAAIVLGWRLARAREPKIEALAVLPLSNLTGDPGQEFLSDGVTEDLTTQLARIDPLRVVSRTSAMRYRGTRKSLPEIGRELSVDAVIEGAVQRPEGRIRITVQLIQAGTDRHLWANTYEGTIDDVLVLEAQATRDIASQIKLNLAPQVDERLRRARRVEPQAYQAYQKGRRAAAIWDRPRLSEAIKYFEEAVEKDPQYASAYAQLAHAYGMLSFQRAIAPEENAAKFRAFTQKALELDEGLADVHVNLGDIKFYGDWNWSDGEAEFHRAVELDRGSADAQEHYAICLWALGQYDAAAQEMRRALWLDPLSPRLTAELGSILHDQGDTQAAIRQYTKALGLEPAYAAAFAGLGDIYEELGRNQEAIAAYLRAASLNGEDPETIQRLSDGFESGGFQGYWTKRLELIQTKARQETVSPLAFAAVYVRLGQHDEAIKWLDRAYRQHIHALVWINASKRWAPLRSDTRFQALLRTMRFPEL